MLQKQKKNRTNDSATRFFREGAINKKKRFRKSESTLLRRHLKLSCFAVVEEEEVEEIYDCYILSTQNVRHLIFYLHASITLSGIYISRRILSYWLFPDTIYLLFSSSTSSSKRYKCSRMLINVDLYKTRIIII